MKSETKALLLGMLIGQALWALAYLAAVAYPGTALSEFAIPAKLHAWASVYGSDANHPNGADTHPLHIAVGLTLYGALGGIAGALIHRRRSKPGGTGQAAR